MVEKKKAISSESAPPWNSLQSVSSNILTSTVLTWSCSSRHMFVPSPETRLKKRIVLGSRHSNLSHEGSPYDTERGLRSQFSGKLQLFSSVHCKRQSLLETKRRCLSLFGKSFLFMNISAELYCHTLYTLYWLNKKSIIRLYNWTAFEIYLLLTISN